MLVMYIECSERALENGEKLPEEVDCELSFER